MRSKHLQCQLKNRESPILCPIWFSKSDGSRDIHLLPSCFKQDTLRKIDVIGRTTKPENWVRLLKKQEEEQVAQLTLDKRWSEMSCNYDQSSDLHVRFMNVLQQSLHWPWSSLSPSHNDRVGNKVENCFLKALKIVLSEVNFIYMQEWK